MKISKLPDDDGLTIIEIPTRICYLCKEEKSLSDFPKHKLKQYGIDPRCRVCIKKSSQLVRKLRKFAPPKPDSCKCCKKITEKLVLDHDKETETFRGWICDLCNGSLGLLGDNLESIEKHTNLFKNYLNNRRSNK